MYVVGGALLVWQKQLFQLNWNHKKASSNWKLKILSFLQNQFSCAKGLYLLGHKSLHTFNISWISCNKKGLIKIIAGNKIKFPILFYIELNNLHALKCFAFSTWPKLDFAMRILQIYVAIWYYNIQSNETV